MPTIRGDIANAVIKFNRNYTLQIATTSVTNFLSTGVSGNTLTIQPPFTIEFDITRSTLSSANVCQLRIYNLSEINRNQIRHNRCDYGGYRRIEFRAGYGNNLASVFHGNISAAWSVREGVNFVTTIECYDGGYGYVNGECNLTFPAGTPIQAIITQIAGTLKSKNISIGAIGSYPGIITRGNTYSGNTMTILTELTGGGAFIDNEKFYALGTNEYVASLSSIGVINSESGLLGTPELEGGQNGQYTVRFDMLFEPGLTVGRIIQLDSSTAASSIITTKSQSLLGPGFNGKYTIKSIKHRGMISGAVCGNAITTGTFWYNKNPAAVPGK